MAPENMPMAEPFLGELQNLVRAHYPLIHISTHEEDRCLTAIRLLAAQMDKKVFLWSTSRGCHAMDPAEDVPAASRYRLADLTAAIEFFEKQVTTKARDDNGFIFVLLDPFPYLSDRSINPIYRRRLRDFAISIRTKSYQASCLVISPTGEMPVELEKEVTVIDFPLPSRAEITGYMNSLLDRLGTRTAITVDDDPGLTEKLVDAALGLTLAEIEGALVKAVVEDTHLTAEAVDKIFRQKQQIVRKSGVLDYIDTGSLALSEIGGLKVFKEWLRIRAATFSPKARGFGIEAPKGVLLTGIPGCGKSWAAKCVAASWRLPLVRLDMGKIYSALIGSSEEHMRHAIQTAEAIAPCILWIDEIEKGLPRPRGYIGDSGVSLRVLGKFLTWMQEKTAPVFVFATANQIDLLPPEVLRKGRFDEVFFVDLPSSAERREILRIHLSRVGRDPQQLDLEELVRLSGPEFLGDSLSLTGAELAAWINEALIHAFDRGADDLMMDDFRLIARQTVPLAQMRQEEIREMREWASMHAMDASSAIHRRSQLTPELGVLEGGASAGGLPSGELKHVAAPDP
ncbi:AAA family ATPase [Nitrospirillum viridazoti]|uniref:Uncharacterized AAA domain-containing protein ycf46 n=1 Tax=Nitrospirillum amazonense TaxID=28077 RepID=A0A560HP01_9PROT|nr:AAA family ATPase [Nitrospirillum amazonense]TWB47691.1 SpoVK/Ycf46/Vps4 family AAA+-type ATPase [Nitrospirillum amazonense]